MAATQVEFPAPSGLTLTLLLALQGDPNTVVNGQGSACTELANMPGWYQATVTQAVAGRCNASVVNQSGVPVVLFAVDMEDDTATHRPLPDSELDSLGQQLEAITSGQVSVASPLALDDQDRVRLTLVRGDSYTGDRALTWTNAAGSWPDLTEATIKLTIRQPKRNAQSTAEPAVALELDGQVVVASGPGQQVKFAPTSAQTAQATPGVGLEYDVQAKLPGGEDVTLAGPGWPATILRDQTLYQAP